MTAPRSAPGSEKLERELLIRLGLDPSASPEEIANAHQAVSMFLANAPRHLRSWARAQAAGADEAYALLTDPAALARAAALVGAGTRPAVAPAGPATPPARQDTRVPAAAAAQATTAAGASARGRKGASAVAAAMALAAPVAAAPVAVDENGKRIVSDEELDALLAEVDPGAHRSVVGTPLTLTWMEPGVAAGSTTLKA